jgi:hypothetical protein
MSHKMSCFQIRWNLHIHTTGLIGICQLRPQLILSTVILAIISASTANAVSVPEMAYGQIASEKVFVTLQVVSLRTSTEKIVRSYFRDIPVMVEIARCESTFRHELQDGSILQGRVDPADTGVMQINKRYHEADAIAMQLNLDDIYHNMAFARHLYETQGVQPWSASMPCWGNTLAVNY